MQALTAAPRSGLTEAQVRALLGAPAVSVDYGCEVLAPDLTVRDDLGADFAGGTVERSMGADVHGTCSLALARALVWGVDLVRPYMVLSGGRTSARWNTGVYCLTTPKRVIGSTPETYDVTGYDRLYLLNRQVAADYTVAAGTGYLAAVRQAFTDAGLTGVLVDSTAEAATLPAAKTWPLVRVSTNPDDTNTPVTWLRVVNDLLTAINYRGVWADQDGQFRCEPYADPTSRAVEWTFDTGDLRGVPIGLERALTEDVWATPNRWVFIASNPPEGVTPSVGNGLVYQVDNASDGPTSQQARGLVWPATYTYEAASAATLKGLGDRRVAADRRLTSTFDVTVGAFPGAGHADVYLYRDPAAGGDRRVQLSKYSMPLDGSDMSMTWGVIA